MVEEREKPRGKHNKLESRFEEGIWAGFVEGSNEYWIRTPEGPKKTRTCRRIEQGNKYDKQLLNSIKGRPKSEEEEEEAEYCDEDEAPIECKEKEGKDSKEDEPQHRKEPRRFRITYKDVKERGGTEGCMGCRNIMAGLPQKDHSKACRERFEEILRKTPAGRERVEHSYERIGKR